MELELDFPAFHNRTGWVMAILGAMLLLGGLGYFFTPGVGDQAKILTWSEWQVQQGEGRFTRELDRLQGEAGRLAELLARPPDPVRAQLLAARLARVYAEGEPALETQRARLIAAAQVVQAWATGIENKSAAQTAVDETFEALEAVTPHDDG